MPCKPFVVSLTCQRIDLRVFGTPHTAIGGTAPDSAGFCRSPQNGYDSLATNCVIHEEIWPRTHRNASICCSEELVGRKKWRNQKNYEENTHKATRGSPVSLDNEVFGPIPLCCAGRIVCAILKCCGEPRLYRSGKRTEIGSDGLQIRYGRISIYFEPSPTTFWKDFCEWNDFQIFFCVSPEVRLLLHRRLVVVNRKWLNSKWVLEQLEIEPSGSSWSLPSIPNHLHRFIH